MKYHIDIQHASDEMIPISDETLRLWATHTLQKHKTSAELTLRFVSSTEMTDLNKNYRKKEGPTNVLAFPASYPSTITLDYPYLGDVIICPLVLEEESVFQQKPLKAHWAHIVIHGILHLLGYDHIKEEDAKIMQALEIQLLHDLTFENPYGEDKSIE